MSVGYFIYDTVCCMAIHLDWANMLHHTASLLGMAVGIAQGWVRACMRGCFAGKCCGAKLTSGGTAVQSGSELVLCLLLMEVSNPFLHTRFMLKVRHSHGCGATCSLEGARKHTLFDTCRSWGRAGRGLQCSMTCAKAALHDMHPLGQGSVGCQHVLVPRADAVCGHLSCLPHHHWALPDLPYPEQPWQHGPGEGRSAGHCTTQNDACASVRCQQQKLRAHLQAGAAGIQVVSLFWFYRIAQVCLMLLSSDVVMFLCFRDRKWRLALP